MPRIHVRFEEREGVLQVTPLAPRLDADVALEFLGAALPLARGRAAVVVSLSHVVTMDASGLAAIVAVQKELAPGGRVRLVDVAPPVAALLARTRLDELFCGVDAASPQRA